MENILHIPLRRRDGTIYICTIDAADWPLVENYNWYAKVDKRGNRTPYVQGRLKKTHRSRNPTVFMHQLILGKQPKGHQVDHKDRNGLNNCRSNLRSVTEHMNQMNKRPRGGTSKYKGVSRTLKPLKDGTRTWKVCINAEGKKRLFVGNFKDEIDAARAYDAAFILHHGTDIGTNVSLGLLPPVPTEPEEYEGERLDLAA